MSMRIPLKCIYIHIRMNGSAAFRSHNWCDSLCTAGFAASSGFWLHQAMQPRLEPAVSSGQEVRVVSAALSWFPLEMVISFVWFICSERLPELSML